MDSESSQQKYVITNELLRKPDHNKGKYYPLFYQVLWLAFYVSHLLTGDRIDLTTKPPTVVEKLCFFS